MERTSFRERCSSAGCVLLVLAIAGLTVWSHCGGLLVAGPEGYAKTQAWGEQNLPVVAAFVPHVEGVQHNISYYGRPGYGPTRWSSAGQLRRGRRLFLITLHFEVSVAYVEHSVRRTEAPSYLINEIIRQDEDSTQFGGQWDLDEAGWRAFVASGLDVESLPNG